jgi:GNAT superfamily N-acetyltransferase
MSLSYNVENFIQNDLSALPQLQPDGWPDILPHYVFYLDAGFCLPVKIELSNVLVAVGTAIMHNKTAWLGHIIVHPKHRKNGLGSMITQKLIALLHARNYETIFLIATKLGEPVYSKLGFEKETEYVSYSKQENTFSTNEDLTPFEIRFKNELMDLDYLTTGELRDQLILPHLPNGKVIIENNTLTGFYLPTLGEGVIIASTPLAGKKMIKHKLPATNKIALPVDNVAGTDFLLQHGFTEGFRGAKMRLGKKIPCKPENIYGRIGGNLG